MNNGLLVSVKVHLEDGVILVDESSHGDWVVISYQEGDFATELPALTKLQWEKLKRAGDYVFGEIIGE